MRYKNRIISYTDDCSVTRVHVIKFPIVYLIFTVKRANCSSELLLSSKNELTDFNAKCCDNMMSRMIGILTSLLTRAIDSFRKLVRFRLQAR